MSLVENKFVWVRKASSGRHFNAVKIVQQLKSKADVDSLVDSLEAVREFLPNRSMQEMIFEDIAPQPQEDT